MKTENEIVEALMKKGEIISYDLENSCLRVAQATRKACDKDYNELFAKCKEIRKAVAQEIFELIEKADNNIHAGIGIVLTSDDYNEIKKRFLK